MQQFLIPWHCCCIVQAWFKLIFDSKWNYLVLRRTSETLSFPPNLHGASLDLDDLINQGDGHLTCSVASRFASLRLCCELHLLGVLVLGFSTSTWITFDIGYARPNNVSGRAKSSAEIDLCSHQYVFNSRKRLRRNSTGTVIVILIAVAAHHDS